MMINMRYLRAYIIFIFITIFSSSTSLFAQTNSYQAGISSDVKIIKAIEVKGNKTISIATILAKIKSRVGQEYIQSVISDDLKRLYNTGYFSDVRVDRQDYKLGFKVVLYVEEKSIVEEITFSKTRYIKSRVIERKITTQVGKFLDNKTLNADTVTIKQLFSKKGLTKAEVEVETFIDEVTNKASIHFVIREGHKVKISKINIYGNNSFKDRKIYKVIKTRSKGWFNSGFLREEVLKEDMDRVSSFYEQNGYIDAVADFTIAFLYQGKVEVDITVDEGQRYYIGNVQVAGSEILSDKEVRHSMQFIQDGNVFSREKLSVDISNIRSLYFDRGYIFAKVNESTSLDPDSGAVEVKIEIEEGGLAYIEKVKIQGNTRTRDIVIRRELRMLPGDRFDGAKLKRSRERLENLGYFEEVNFDIEDTDIYDRKNLIVQVKEAKTGTFSFGGGFSTVDQIVGFIEIEQRNFDFSNWPTFTGGGQQLLLRAETGSTRNNLRLSFTEPWIFDHPVSGGFDVYKTSRNREKDVGFAYDEERVGGGIRFGNQFTEYVRAGINYKFEEVTIENFESNVSAALAEEEGTNTVSLIGLNITRDERDSIFSPTKGYVINGSTDVAGGILGADRDFYRAQFSGSYYMPFKWKSVLEIRLKAGFVKGYNSQKVPIFERFFAGGARSIRGYNERGVGPIDFATTDPIGGESMIVGSIEYTIPLIDFLKLAVFLDTGSVEDKASKFAAGSFKTGAGLGARVKTPIGPIKLDYGVPFNLESGEDKKTGKFYFSVSRGF